MKCGQVFAAAACVAGCAILAATCGIAFYYTVERAFR